MFTWTPEMIRLMQNANARSEYHRQLAAILAPKLAGCRTLCDAGCGLGSLSAALSPYFDAITAADVSDAALDVLRETIRTQNLTNITPLPCDLLQSTDRTRYDGMVFCFFGSLAEILPVACRQCAKTLVIIKKNYELHRFSLTAQPIRGETAPAACEALRAMGIPFTFDAQELEHGQPFASLDAMTRGDLQIMLKELVDEQGMACLFVTHDMDEAFVVARRVVVMRGGRAAATFEAEEFSGWERRERVRDHILTCLGRKQGA